jgi:hypothetical protein
MPTEKRTEREKRTGASRSGGDALYGKYGAEHMRRIGARGTATTQAKYGLRFYSEIARRKRGQKRTGTDSETV